MINFRYHLVSLIAVFLALSVGVVLGAGPLQNAIHGAATGTDSGSDAKVSAKLAAAQRLGEQGEVYVQDVAQQVLPGGLEDQTVALVLLPAVDNDAVEQTELALEWAGAQIVGQTELTDAWVSANQATYRETLSSAVSGNLEERPADTSASGILGQALVEVLTTTGSNADLLEEMLSDERTPLLKADTLPEKVADLLILVGPGPVEQGDTAAADGAQSSEQEAGQKEDRAPWVGLAEAVGSAGGVAVGHAEEEGQFITVLRQADVPLATVDQAGTAMAALNAVQVLASGQEGQFGQGIGATTPVADLWEDAADRAPVDKGQDKAKDGAKDGDKASDQEGDDDGGRTQSRDGDS